MSALSERKIIPKHWRFYLGQHHTGPFWTPRRSEIAAFSRAFREHLAKRSSVWDSEIFSVVPDTYDSCWSMVGSWHKNNDVPVLDRDSSLWNQWLDARLSCEAIDVMAGWSSYYAQYMGVSKDGKRTLTVMAYCGDTGWRDRIAPYDILHGGNCVVYVNYDPELEVITGFWVGT